MIRDPDYTVARVKQGFVVIRDLKIATKPGTTTPIVFLQEEEAEKYIRLIRCSEEQIRQGIPD